jgi:hypothetical protein
VQVIAGAQCIGVSSTEVIEEYFADYFQHWSISLPPDSVRARTPGHIFEHRWHIGYLWGTENDEEYLEVLAQHRMTDDSHFRVFASGRVEDLPAPAEAYSYGPNATDQEKAEAEREYVEYNRRIHAQLRDLGLLPPPGENLPAHEINEYLRSGGPVD